MALLAAGTTGTPSGERAPTAYDAAVHLARDIGSRPAASDAELRAHRYVARRFGRGAGGHAHPLRRAEPRQRPVAQRRRRIRRAAPLPEDRHGAHRQRPGGPGRGRQRVGRRRSRRTGSAARSDPSVRRRVAGRDRRRGAPLHRPGRPSRRASARQARAPRAQRAPAALRPIARHDRPRRPLQVSSPHAGLRPRVEGQFLAAGRRSDVTLRFDSDSDTGNSDHREFELAGLPGLVIHLWHGLEPCYHSGCDTWQRIQRRSLRRVQRVTELALRRR